MYQEKANEWRRSAKAFVLVYDVTSRISFEAVKETWLPLALALAENASIKDHIFVICGNKCDLDASRAVKADEGEQLAASVSSSFKSLFFETSTVSKVNLKEMFEAIGRAYLEIYSDSLNGSKEAKAKSDRGNCAIS